MEIIFFIDTLQFSWMSILIGNGRELKDNVRIKVWWKELHIFNFYNIIV
jgi:hypothetical protein